jgi:plastocyanin
MVGTIVVGAALAGVAVPPALSSRVAGSPPAAGAPAPAVAGQVKTYEIQVKDMAFAPAMQNARVGDTISWVNVGKIPHTVTAKNHLFDATLSPGQRFNLVLRKQGDIDYVCSYHSVMVGMLHVGPALAGVKVPAAGAGSSGAARNVAAISPLGLAGLGTGWLLVIGLLAAAQLRARITNLAGAAALRMQVPSPDPS